LSLVHTGDDYVQAAQLLGHLAGHDLHAAAQGGIDGLGRAAPAQANYLP
jgi:hypothetical protein